MIRAKKMVREEQAKGMAIREARRQKQKSREEELELEERGMMAGKKDTRTMTEGVGIGSANVN